MSDQATQQPMLQVDQAMADLAKAAEANAEAVRELLRRIEPVLVNSGIVVGTLNVSGATGFAVAESGFVITSGRAPLALSIDKKRMDIDDLTKEVNKALGALQI